MSKNYKKDILSQIVDGGVYGAPQQNQTVKFQYATSIATAAGSQTDGAITFAADASGNAGIYIKGTLVSSKIQNVAAAVKTGAHHGGKTVTVTYIGNAGSIETSTFDVIDEAALEAYLTGSKTISLDSNNIAEVKVDGATILVDESNGLKSGLKIAYVAETAGVGAKIQLQDANNTSLSSIEVSDIVGDGILKDSIYHEDTNILELRFGNGKIYDAADSTTYSVVNVDIKKLIDINDVFIGAASHDFLDVTNDTSTLTLNVKKADVTFTAKSETTAANLTVDTTAGEVLVASDAIPAIKSYIDAKQSDNGIEVESLNEYVDASVDANNNKKIFIKADVENLTFTEGTAPTDSTLTGTANKLVDAADAASKVTSFVNTRISEEIAKLDGDVTSDDNTYVTVEVKTAGGEVDDVIVTQTKSTITADATTLSATAGIADGSEFATGVKTYVDAQIDALDSSLNIKSGDEYLTFDASVVNGKIVEGHIGYTAADTTFADAEGNNPASLEVTTPGILTSDAIADIVSYVDAKTGNLDSSVTGHDTSSFLVVNTVQENGALSAENVTVQYTALTVAPGSVTVDTAGFATGNDVKTAVEGALTWTVLP